MRDNTWTDYVSQFTVGGWHMHYPRWKVCGVWDFTRSDGLHSAHYLESPFAGPGSKRRTCEESMRLADTFIPLDAELPDGMRWRHDPDYGPLWDKQ